MTELTKALLDPLFLVSAGASCAIFLVIILFYYITKTSSPSSPSSIFEDIKLLRRNPIGSSFESNQHEKKPIVSTRKYERKADM